MCLDSQKSLRYACSSLLRFLKTTRTEASGLLGSFAPRARKRCPHLSFRCKTAQLRRPAGG